jgi:Raf kinase inhibitor-like YbhB/YbcL family protein
MQITSSQFDHEGVIPSKYTCDGENINPPIKIHEVPEQAKTLVLLMDDPDVPTSIREDGMWDHWVLFNIPPETKYINENSVPPEAVSGVNTGKASGYGGPCPPDREHRYYFKLYALDIVIDLDDTATKADVESAMQGHIIARSELMGRYNRPQNQ